MTRLRPKELAQFGSVSGSEILNLPISLNGIISLYLAEPEEPSQFGSVSGLERIFFRSQPYDKLTTTHQATDCECVALVTPGRVRKFFVVVDSSDLVLLGSVCVQCSTHS